LLQISGRAKGLSGRTLRKLPFLTYANYFSTKQTGPCSLAGFLQAMSTAVDKELKDRQAVAKSSNFKTPTASKRPSANFNITL